MIYAAEDIARIVNGKLVKVHSNPVTSLLLDSRKIFSPGGTVFFAVKSSRRDGHQFIPELYKKGIRDFVVCEKIDWAKFETANFIIVKDTIAALQQLAAFHRRQFDIPVIGITGSNGKTIVKEWLCQLLHADYNIVSSPKSYNSQIGVPLSVWQMNEKHTLAIFEAGISRPGEMEKLETILKPTVGVFTNIGEAHSEGFESISQKEKEKRILFRNAKEPAPLQIISTQKKDAGTEIVATDKHRSAEEISINIPFTDEASVQNAVTCWQVMLQLGYKNEIIKERMKNLAPVTMRLELKKAINGCSVINDSYSADINSLDIALNFLGQQSGTLKRTAILSDFLQSRLPPAELYAQVLALLKKYKVNKLIAVGEYIGKELIEKPKTEIEVQSFISTEDFIQHFRFSTCKEECILVKGARVFAFERIVHLLEQKAHQTVLEINLTAIAHNLKQYQQQLLPATKVMAMVKAFAYGSGGAEVAGILQYHKVDYLGVAYADEGVELRKAGISLPIMVMNPEKNTFETIIENNLEPELYSFELLHAFDLFLRKEGLEQYPVHIEIETGMNRLGFGIDDIEKLADILQSTGSVKVKSIFSHLAASEEAAQDAFTFSQFEKFKLASTLLENKIGYPFIAHIANSAAAVRHPGMQMDMVRLGIGLYGVDSAATGKMNLQTVATLKSTIAQVKHLKKGDTVSYNRKEKIEKNTTIATIRIGYADGYPRRLGNGIGKILIQGKLVPVVGTVCMDMFMIDITAVPSAREGDDVIIFGEDLPVQQVAEWAQTIPYEIMTGISQRVKRVYYEE